MVRKEGGFTLKARPQRVGNGWVFLVEPNDRSTKANELQEEWLEANEGKLIKLARENVRHPDE